MTEWQVRHRRAEFDPRRESGQRSNERQAIWNVFGEIGQMLAAIAFAVAELVGEDERVAVLAQRLGVASAQRMNGHDEEAELHDSLHGRRKQRARLCDPAARSNR
jgi:hypothetical protein